MCNAEADLIDNGNSVVQILKMKVSRIGRLIHFIISDNNLITVT